MSWITILWAMAAAAAITLAVVHALVWTHDRTAQANLVFSIIALSVAGMVPTELGMMHATSPAEYGMWVRWFHLPLFFTITGLILFVRMHLGTGRAWLGWTVIAIRCVVLAGNFLLPQPNFTWSEIHSLKRVPFLGEEVSAIAHATIGQGQWLATGSVILFTLFVTDAALTLWRRGGAEQRRRAMVVGGGIVAFVVMSILLTQTVVWGILQMPVLMSPPFLLTVGAMAFDLSRDIFISRSAQRESDELRSELAHSGRVSLLGQLSGSLAHELNQPLGIILSNAQAAQRMLDQDSPDLTELREILADIVGEDRRAGEVITRLRSLLKHGQTQMIPLSLNEVIEDVLRLLRSDIVARGVTMETAFEDGLPTVLGDPVQLRQVLLNLIINGSDAMAQDLPADRILKISTSLRKDRVCLLLKDRGCGLPEGDARRIFEPFFTTKSQGMGIGLSICRSIIAAHHGSLWAESNAGRGATFHLELPITQPPPP